MESLLRTSALQPPMACNTHATCNFLCDYKFLFFKSLCRMNLATTLSPSLSLIRETFHHGSIPERSKEYNWSGHTQTRIPQSVFLKQDPCPARLCRLGPSTSKSQQASQVKCSSQQDLNQHNDAASNKDATRLEAIAFPFFVSLP